MEERGSTAAEGETIIAIVASCCADVSGIEGQAAGNSRWYNHTCPGIAPFADEVNFAVAGIDVPTADKSQW